MRRLLAGTELGIDATVDVDHPGGFTLQGLKLVVVQERIGEVLVVCQGGVLFREQDLIDGLRDFLKPGHPATLTRCHLGTRILPAGEVNHCRSECHGSSVLARFDVADAMEDEGVFRLRCNLPRHGPADADQHDDDSCWSPHGVTLRGNGAVPILQLAGWEFNVGHTARPIGLLLATLRLSLRDGEPFKGGRPEGAAPPIIVAIGRNEVLLVVSLDTVQMRATETPKVPPHGQSLDAPIAVEDLDLHALRYRLEPLATAAPLQ